MLIYLDVLLEVIENRLPSLLLHIRRIYVLWVERFRNPGSPILLSKSNLDLPPVIHNVFDILMLSDYRILTAKIKTLAPVLAFHASSKLSSHPQIISRARRMPIIRRIAPFGNVLRTVPILPHLIYGRIDKCLNCNLFFHI